MALFTKGQPLVSKLATLAAYVVLPGAMAAAVMYSPPDYARSSTKPSNVKSSTNYARVSFFGIICL